MKFTIAMTEPRPGSGVHGCIVVFDTFRVGLRECPNRNRPASGSLLTVITLWDAIYLERAIVAASPWASAIQRKHPPRIPSSEMSARRTLVIAHYPRECRPAPRDAVSIGLRRNG